VVERPREKRLSEVYLTESFLFFEVKWRRNLAQVLQTHQGKRVRTTSGRGGYQRGVLSWFPVGRFADLAGMIAPARKNCRDCQISKPAICDTVEYSKGESVGKLRQFCKLVEEADLSSSGIDGAGRRGYGLDG